MAYGNSVSIFDRTISAVSYLTGGVVGVVCFVALYLCKKRTTHFLRFNVIQAIFLTLLYAVLSMGLNLIMGILIHIPLIKILAAYVDFIFNRPFIADYSIIQFAILLIVVYLVVFSILGKYPRLYKISEIVDMSAR